MQPQQPHFQMPPMGGPPPQEATALARVLRLARGLTMPTLAASGIVIALQLVMPDGHRPSDWIGQFHASILNAEIRTKRDEANTFAREQAEAAAVPPAVMQMEVEAFRQQQQRMADSLEAQSTIANMADLACVIGGMIPRDSRDWRDVGDGLRSACGVSDQVRSNMTDTFAREGRRGSTLYARPAPRPGAAVPTSPAR